MPNKVENLQFSHVNIGWLHGDITNCHYIFFWFCVEVMSTVNVMFFLWLQLQSEHTYLTDKF